MPSTRKTGEVSSDAWILQLRSAKNQLDPTRPYAYFVERERTIEGAVDDVATVFLTNKECPFRCLMCDLWKNTTDEPVAPGVIPGQIRWALDRLPPAQHIKLYNSGNFFDPQAIPPDDYRQIAETVRSFETVVVESHPRMVGRRCLAFHELLTPELHVAIGLETVHPDVLLKLNKRMTLKDFEQAVHTLRVHGMQARAFILLRPPYLSEAEGIIWARRSIDFAFDVGVECSTIIPTRSGNGAMEVLTRRGDFAPPSLDSLEVVLEYGIAQRRGRVFADLWNIEKMSPDVPFKAARVERLARMNLTQSLEPPIDHQAAE